MNESEKKSLPRTARRRVLKAVGGGTVAGGLLLPNTWSQPLVNSVILPAHAQTTPGEFDGVYSTGMVTTHLFGRDRRWWAWSDLLEGLIPSAHASHDDVRQSVCGEDLENPGGGAFQIVVAINGSNVRICFSSTGGFQECTKEAGSTISGASIASTSIDPVDGDIDGLEDQETVFLNNLIVIDGPKVQGQLEIEAAAGAEDEQPSCVQEFVADLIPGLAFSCPEGCTGED